MAFKPTQQLCARTEARIKGFRSPAIKILRGAIVGTNELELPGVLKQDHSVKRSPPSNAVTRPSKAASGSGVSSIPKSELLALQRKFIVTILPNHWQSSGCLFCLNESVLKICSPSLRIKIWMEFVKAVETKKRTRLEPFAIRIPRLCAVEARCILIQQKQNASYATVDSTNSQSRAGVSQHGATTSWLR